MNNRKRGIIQKQPMKFNITQLDKIIILLLMGKHPLINKKLLHNIWLLFESFEPGSYTENEKHLRVTLIKKLIHKCYNEGIQDKEALLSFININGVYKERIEQLLGYLKEQSLTDEEILALDTMIADELAYGFIDNHYNVLINMLNDYKTENYEDFTQWIDEFNEIIGELNYKIKTRKATTIDSKNDVELNGNSIITSLSQLISRKKNPALKIRTGIKALNDMLNGGFEPGRLYLALGVAKSFKSGLLLNSCLWAKKYNPNLKAKDPNKQPVILYITQENSISETLERVWSSLFGNHSKIEDYSPETAMRMLQEHGIVNSADDTTSPEIVFKYRSNGTISAVDIDAMIEELSNEGKEVVFLVHDYIRRLKSSVRRNKELRLELSDISNELKTLAVERDIPILTAAQLNREAFRIFEEADNIEEKFNSMKKIGAANVGESIDLIQNVDYAFTISMSAKRTQLHPDQEPILEYFLHVKEVASRFKDNGAPKHFIHPFPEGNTMALVEDADLATSYSIFEVNDFIEEKVNNIQSKRGLINMNMNKKPPKGTIIGGDVFILREKDDR